jgi:hypothetical protein
MFYTRFIRSSYALQIQPCRYNCYKNARFYTWLIHASHALHRVSNVGRTRDLNLKIGKFLNSYAHMKMFHTRFIRASTRFIRPSYELRASYTLRIWFIGVPKQFAITITLSLVLRYCLVWMQIDIYLAGFLWSPSSRKEKRKSKEITSKRKLYARIKHVWSVYELPMKRLQLKKHVFCAKRSAYETRIKRVWNASAQRAYEVCIKQLQLKKYFFCAKRNTYQVRMKRLWSASKARLKHVWRASEARMSNMLHTRFTRAS